MANGNARLSADQQVFASVLAAETKLDPTVVAAWTVSENGGSSSNGANNWLGVGIQNSGKYGANSPIWKNPVTAAVATAQWLKGQRDDIGGGRASPQIQAIAATAGQPVTSQIAAIRYNGKGGWSTAGEPAIQGAYNDIKTKGGFVPVTTAKISSALQKMLGSNFDSILSSGGLTIDSSGNIGWASGQDGTAAGVYTGSQPDSNNGTSVTDGLSSIAGTLGTLTQKSVWIRLTEIIAGILAVAIGVIIVTKGLK